jgi:hypothetical protein
MTVKQLIKKLNACDENAKVLITVGNEDDDTLSTSKFEIHHADDNDYIELFVNEKKCTKQL